MAVSLKKGQGVSLRKSENDLSTVTIGLGWDVQETKKGLLGTLFSKKEEEYDLDVVAFLCDAAGKVRNLGQAVDGRRTLVGGDIVFFNSLRHNSGAIWLTGDNLTGAGDGDDEQIVARLNDLPSGYDKIVFVVQIYAGAKKEQSFGKVNNAYIRAVDAKNKEMVRFEITGGSAQSTYRSMVFAELVREASGWKFHAIGEYSPSDSFVDALKKYL